MEKTNILNDKPIENSDVKTESSVLTPKQTQDRIWIVDTFGVYTTQESTNDEVIDNIRQILYYGKVKAFTVTQKLNI